ncbi:MAG: type II CRISPR RNA-guided endonuclease Cas9 [Methanomassiliicoccaceae archaeon]|nr:type II CRISPR RNA-guided endonuclease Cas9 [Methanomassiliicoccaceae archaeon]
MKKIFGDYYLGLDIGTDSVGWAVTDPDYNILEFNRKAMWGIHLFKSGETAEKRRSLRTARRRLQRRKQRISLLRDLFRDEINAVDPGFYDRLDSSRLQSEDRNDIDKGTFLSEIGLQDPYLNKKYPTIYHLRHDLMTSDAKPDIRLVYMAAHHIIKNRGHFLFDGLSDNAEIPDFNTIFDEFQAYLTDEFGIEMSVKENIGEIKSALLDRSAGITDKGRMLQRLFSVESAEQKAVATLLAGGTVSMDKLFQDEELKEIKVTFKGTSFEDSRSELEDFLGPEKMQLLNLMKQIFDWSILSGLLSESNTISEAKIKQYNQHRIDLKQLKSVVREHSMNKYGDMRLYNEIFKSDIENNYCFYSGVTKKLQDFKNEKCTQDDFCTSLSKKLEGFDFGQNEATRIMGERIGNKTFMPKQVSKENSVIPNILHKKELTAILDKASKHYPFLLEKDDSGLSVKEKIEIMCSFRIPYFVGPLNPDSERAWAVRKSGERVTPWNFEQVIDLEESSVKFIDRLIGKCSYLHGEKVVPKQSIIYSRYMLYNELNNIKVNGERIDPKLKLEIVRELFETDRPKKVTVKTLGEFISAKTGIKGAAIEGIDVNVKANLRSEMQIRKIIGDKSKNIQMAEDIIRCITIFGDERKRLRARLESDYSELLSKQEIESLSKLKYEDWGRLSERLLTGIVHKWNDGQSLNILNALEQTNRNLMELLSKDYTYAEQIDAINSQRGEKHSGQISYDMVEDLYCSPAVKRGIWRALSIINEILKITGRPPKKVFIETTREDQAIKKKPDSRKENLIRLYKNCKDQERDWAAEIGGIDEGRFRGKKLYAYYTQMGRCMYCGKSIDLNSLGSDDSDMDHIFPQSKKTDDSVHNNMVLVCKNCNMSKSDKYPIPQEWQNKMGAHWKYLLECGLISKEKYSRLTRNSELTDSELSDFINRQLVETSQSVKAVAEVTKQVFGKDSDIVYVKGGNVSRFRQEYGYVKARNVNDYHHAKDAYLNIVVGNVYDVKFTKNPIRIITGEKYNLNRMFDYDVRRNGVTAWISGESGTGATVSKYMRRNNIRYTRSPYKNTGKLFDVNIMKKGLGQYPISTGLPIDRYGGYNKVSGSHFALVEHGDKGKRKRTLESVPVLLASKEMGREELNEFFRSSGLVEPDVRIECIKMDAMMEINGFRATITGRSNERIISMGAEQLILPYDVYDYCRSIYNFVDAKKATRNKVRASDYRITSEMNNATYDVLMGKLNGRYAGLLPLSTQQKTLMSGREAFMGKDLETQANVLSEILSIFQCNSNKADLREIGGGKNVGALVLNNNVLKYRSFFMINQSPSGLFETRTDLKTI